MSSNHHLHPAVYTPESEEPVLSENALKLAKKMEPEELCRFIKIVDGFIEKGVNAEELPGGVSMEELLDVRKEIRRIIINKISGAIDLRDYQKPAKRRKPAGIGAELIQFPAKPKPKPAKTMAKRGLAEVIRFPIEAEVNPMPKHIEDEPVKQVVEKSRNHLRIIK